MKKVSVEGSNAESNTYLAYLQGFCSGLNVNPVADVSNQLRIPLAEQSLSMSQSQVIA